MYASMLSLVATRQIIVQNHKSIRLSLGLLATAILWVGCTTAVVTVNPTFPTQIEPGEALAVLPVGYKGDEQVDESSSFAGAKACISDAIRKNFPKTRIISQDELQRAAFPDPPESQALISPMLLVDDPTIRNRIAALGLRYLVSVEGQTVQEVDELIAEAGHGATMLGVQWDRNSFVQAEVFDLKQGRSLGQFRASASGSPTFVCIGVLFFCFPIVVPAFTETKVCSEVGEAAVKFFSGEAPSEPSSEAKQTLPLDGDLWRR